MPDDRTDDARRMPSWLRRLGALRPSALLASVRAGSGAGSGAGQGVSLPGARIAVTVVFTLSVAGIGAVTTKMIAAEGTGGGTPGTTISSTLKPGTAEAGTGERSLPPGPSRSENRGPAGGADSGRDSHGGAPSPGATESGGRDAENQGSASAAPSDSVDGGTPSAGVSGSPSAPVPSGSPTAPSASDGSDASDSSDGSHGSGSGETSMAGSGWLVARAAMDPLSNPVRSQGSLSLTATKPLRSLDLRITAARRPGLRPDGTFLTLPRDSFTITTERRDGALVHRFRLRAGATVPAGTWTFGVQFNHTARSGGPQLDYALLAKPAERGGAALQLSGNF